MLHQGVAYDYNGIEDLKYMMIAKTHARDENDKHTKEMDKLLEENDRNENIVGLVEDNEDWLAAADDEDERDEILMKYYDILAEVRDKWREEQKAKDKEKYEHMPRERQRQTESNEEKKKTGQIQHKYRVETKNKLCSNENKQRRRQRQQ
eukprot:6442012-Amphidinium_carterae.2